MILSFVKDWGDNYSVKIENDGEDRYIKAWKNQFPVLESGMEVRGRIETSKNRDGKNLYTLRPNTDQNKATTSVKAEEAKPGAYSNGQLDRIEKGISAIFDRLSIIEDKMG